MLFACVALGISKSVATSCRNIQIAFGIWLIIMFINAILFKGVVEYFYEVLCYYLVGFVMLKGYIMDRANIDRRYRASSYDTIKRYIPVIRDIIEKSYGEALRNISNPSIMNNKISLNIIDGAKSRQIIHSFALKLKELLIRKETEITFYEAETREAFQFTDQDKIYFILFGILYASRCNNFHGNV